MANYYGTVVSNNFKVKDASEVSDILTSLGFEILENGDFSFGSYEQPFNTDDSVFIDSKTKKAVLAVHIDEYDEEEIDKQLKELGVDKYDEISLGEYLQNKLTSDCIIVSEAGNEKLNYVVTDSCLIDKNTIKWFDAQSLAEQYRNREEVINQTIRRFIKENYGDSEAEEPSYDIDSLSAELHRVLS